MKIQFPLSSFLSFFFAPLSSQGDTKANEMTSEDIDNESKVSNVPGPSSVETDIQKMDQLPQVDPICKPLLLNNSLLQNSMPKLGYDTVVEELSIYVTQ